jgi:hypothetical protein
MIFTVAAGSLKNMTSYFEGREQAKITFTKKKADYIWGVVNRNQLHGSESLRT